MTVAPATSKGAATREAILEHAYGIACSAGLEGLSIGALAHAVRMSKSGVFAHFGSREDLQLAVLDTAAQRFVAHVFQPALRKPRGLARLRTIIEQWFDWVRHEDDGGCLFLAAVSEYDDRPGPQRDLLLQQDRQWRQALAHAVSLAVEAGELRPDIDIEQLVFEIYALPLLVHHDAGLYGFEAACSRGLRAYDRLIGAASLP
ncbi:TetR family transcriptional regulator [Lysobacter arseniciresistens ZS79]|uniref:TetR family transcriptional regulator n=1 Tax=Lysobacter arseniciresistens ZS79 TaxID=913325 RepID=A0A0A0F8E4_9GAMM|nr:TetR/AcrR family transcriptional regulator [Lysobacter arseniciresistens]KGM57662.1 TetR family transcriptional regulator [Lysobacter arseniciresistens ZS79]